MKHLAILAAAGSMAVFAAPAHAAALPSAPAPASSVTFAGFNEGASPFATVAEYDRRDRHWRDDRRWRDNGRRVDNRDRYWRGNDGRWRCRRDDGTVGLLIGAGVGALVGRQIDRAR